MNRNLLDDEKDKLLNTKEEDILWQGTPNPPFVIPYLAHGGHHDVRIGGTSPFLLLLIGTIILAFIFQQIIGNIGIVIASILGIYIFIRPNLILSKRKKNTTYYVLKDGIYFKFLGWRKEQSSFIPFKNIKKISSIPLKTGEGDIIIYPKEKATFITYDFTRNSLLHHPTIIRIKDVKMVAQLINSNL